MNVTLNELGLVKYSISLSSTDVAYKCIHAIGAAMSLLASWLLKIMSHFKWCVLERSEIFAFVFPLAHVF